MTRNKQKAALLPKMSMIAVCAVLFAAGTAYAYTTDVDAGGRIENISGGKRFIVKQRTDSVPGRAELRGSSSTSGVSASGRFKLISGGRWLSVMQVLNVVAAGQTSGPSEPITQLAVRPKSGTSRYEFYIVQGGQLCSGAPEVSIGSSYTVSVTASAGQTPEYTINGVTCKKSNPDGDKAGTVYDGSLKSGRNFYAKMGAYHTSSNQTNRGGDSTAEWTELRI
ncbi:hypothetical protein [Sphingomonas sp. S2-65]|uniref:hypothetical protein n=1 Tax=Sphingomonas sp. S2-65 TaxID=2903960 RepID=UPI001F185AC3|nr:hypothetical protein [Sphingomonas sp. S2-65]UYY60057.1 hypothetical protein LZ586_08220 [Sphingomonas sp. S2-65]